MKTPKKPPLELVIQGYENGYTISDEGVVRNTSTGRVLTPQTNPRGVMCVSLSLYGIATTVPVRKLVADHFLQHPEDSARIIHINRDKRDCRACNLAWVPYKRRALQASVPKHSDADLRRWRKARKDGMSYRAIGAKYHVHHSTIHLALNPPVVGSLPRQPRRTAMAPPSLIAECFNAAASIRSLNSPHGEALALRLCSINPGMTQREASAEIRVVSRLLPELFGLPAL